MLVVKINFYTPYQGTGSGRGPYDPTKDRNNVAYHKQGNERPSQASQSLSAESGHQALSHQLLSNQAEVEPEASKKQDENESEAAVFELKRSVQTQLNTNNNNMQMNIS